MSMIENMVSMLKSGTTDAGIRVYPLSAPDATARPYIIFQRITSNDENVLAGSSGLVNTRMQVDCYADTYASVINLAAQVDALFNAWVTQNVSLGAQDLYESDVKLYRIQADYSIWHT